MRQKITWLGHGSWSMTTKKGTNIYIDPWISDNPACPISLDDIRQADIICVTHGHSDHLGNAIELVKKTGAVLVTIPEVSAYCSNYGIPYDDKGGCVHTGGSIVQKDVRIYAVFALHHSDIMGKEYIENNVVIPGSGTCGMVMMPEEGETVYFSGDTGLFGDMELIGRLYRPYVSVLSVGSKYTMGVREAAYAAEMLRSKYLIPGHYNTFEANRLDIDELIRQVGVRAPETEVIALKPGKTFEL